MIIKSRISRILFFKLIQIRTFFKINRKKISIKNIKGNIYIILANGAGDFLMALESINYIINNSKQEIVLLCFRAEVKKLSELYFQNLKVKVYSNKTKFNQNDLVIGLSGPAFGLSYKLFKSNCHFHGFIYDLKIRSSIVKPYFENLIEKNHIRRNNLITEKLFKLNKRLKDKIPTHKNLNISRNQTFSNKNKKIALYFPQSKKRKALPYKKIEKIFKKLSIDYDVSLIGFTDELVDQDFLKKINNKFIIWEEWIQLFDILKEFDLIITVDSVIYHLCNSMNIQFIGLFGWTSSKALKTENSKCLHIDFSDPKNPCYSGCFNGKRKGQRPICSCNSKEINKPCKIFNKISANKVCSSVEKVIKESNY